MQQAEQSPHMRTREILTLLSIKKTTWHKWVKQGKAPAGIRLSPRLIVWKREDIENFLNNAPKTEVSE